MQSQSAKPEICSSSMDWRREDCSIRVVKISCCHRGNGSRWVSGRKPTMKIKEN